MKSCPYLEMIDSSCSDAVGLFRPFPPSNHIDDRSFFGGVPLAPDGFEWPRATTRPPRQDHQGNWKADLPYSFMCQVDCAALPSNRYSHLLPADGILYFFHDWRWEQYGAEIPALPDVVKYASTEGSKLLHVSPPPDSPPLYNSVEHYYFPWLASLPDPLSHYPRTFIKHSFVPRRVRTILRAAEGDDLSKRCFQEVYDRIADDIFVRDYQPELLALPGWRPGLLAWPLRGFPQIWLGVELVCGYMAARKINPDGLAAWVSRARSHGPFTKVTDEDRAAFEAWCGRASSDMSRDLFEAAFRMVNTWLSRDPDTTVEINSDFIEVVKAAHVPHFDRFLVPVYCGHHTLLVPKNNVFGFPGV